MKTFKDFILENQNDRFAPRVGVHGGDWDQYHKTDFNAHITDEDEPKAGQDVHDLAMQRVSAQHKLDLRHKPALRKFLHNPVGVITHFIQSAKNKSSAGHHYDGQNLMDLQSATQSNHLKVPVTVHIGLDHDPTDTIRTDITHPHISSVSPETALGHTAPVNGVHHIIRVDLNKNDRYAPVGNSTEKDVGPVSNDTFKNAIVVPRGGSFHPSGRVEQYTDKDGREIHIHPMNHRH